jgi:aminoglycoside 3-N-acetyltransferase
MTRSEREMVAALAQEWRQAGLKPGSMVLVHSSLKRTLLRLRKDGNRPGPAFVLQSFIEAVGESGTLLLPLFNFDFTTGKKFDLRNTPSQMGVLTETARSWPGVVRTGHPIYSFAAIGAASGLFRNLRNFSGYGSDSPFGILHRAGGQIAVLDLPDQDSVTFYHHVEEMLGVDYRYPKKFTGDYVDQQGTATRQTFGLFVRDIERGVVTAVNPMGELLWREKIYRGCRPGEGCGLRVIDAATLFDRVKAVILSGNARGLLYEIKN